MGVQKSRSDEFYIGLVTSLIAENPCQLSPLSVIRDCREVVRRTSDEGLSFLTKRLPSLWKAVAHGLETGTFVRPDGFKRRKRTSVLTAFLGNYLAIVFDESGALIPPVTDVVKQQAALQHIFQVCYLLYKLETGYTPDLEERVVGEFVQTERELNFEYTDEVARLLETASHIAENVLSGFDPMDIVPRHGPGAVATGEKQEQKWEFSRLYANINSVYRYSRYYFMTGESTIEDSLGRFSTLERLDSGTAKVVLVPKDSRGPRLISCEPLEYQWIQQGLGRALMSFLEYHPLTRGQINFTDQGTNRRLALESSLTQNFATLDLNAASDRVSVILVESIFARLPALQAALMATRTTATMLPDGTILPLKKFAPMGSALCFPVEAFCFWCLAVASMLREQQRPLEHVAREVYVYGDDIIVPTKVASLVMDKLESVALKINRSKSCKEGYFRESCGMDAFHGVQITPVKIHRLFSAKARSPECLAAYASAANQLREHGYVKCSERIFSSLEKIWGALPYGVSDSPFVCRQVNSAGVAASLNSKRLQSRWSHRWQRLEYYVRTVLKQRMRDTKLDGVSRLLRNQVVPGLEEPGREPIPGAVVTDSGWFPISVALTATERTLLGRG